MTFISFNNPLPTEKMTHYVYLALNSGKISEDDEFPQRCQSDFEEKYGFEKCLITSSCTDGLEMVTMLYNLHGDEVIVSSNTFVFTSIACFIHETKNNTANEGSIHTINDISQQKEQAISPVFCDQSLGKSDYYAGLYWRGRAHGVRLSHAPLVRLSLFYERAGFGHKQY